MCASAFSNRLWQKRLLALAGAAWVAVAVGFVARPSFAQGHGPSRVEALPVVEREVAPTIPLVGTVRPQLRATVASEVAGRVARLPVDEGAFVSEGDLLCKLRDAPRRFEHEEAAARLSELKAALATAEAELKKAEFEKQRIDGLWKLQRSTDKEYNDTLQDYLAAKGRKERARFAAASQAAVVKRLADALACTEILAPFDGYVVAKHTEVGAWISEGGDVMDMLDLSTVRIRVGVPEASIDFCAVGASAFVTVDALGREFRGHISRVIPDADAQARTFPVDIDIPNPAGHLKAGMFVRAHVPSGPAAKRLLVPKDAVLMRGPMSIVYVVRSAESGQTAEVLPVKIVAEVMDHVAVEARGLSAGDLVIVRGNEYLRGPGPVIAVPPRRDAEKMPPVAPGVASQSGSTHGATTGPARSG